MEEPAVAHRCSPSRKGSSLTRSTEPWPSPGPGQERPERRQVSWLAGRHPMHGLPETAWSATSARRLLPRKEPVHRAHRLQLQGQPRIWGHPRTAFPFKPHRGTGAIMASRFGTGLSPSPRTNLRVCQLPMQAGSIGTTKSRPLQTESSSEASAADIRLASDPAASARSPSRAMVARWLGARLPVTAIWIAIELKFAKPHSAKVTMA